MRMGWSAWSRIYTARPTCWDTLEFRLNEHRFGCICNLGPVYVSSDRQMKRRTALKLIAQQAGKSGMNFNTSTLDIKRVCMRRATARKYERSEWHFASNALREVRAERPEVHFTAVGSSCRVISRCVSGKLEIGQVHYGSRDAVLRRRGNGNE